MNDILSTLEVVEPNDNSASDFKKEESKKGHLKIFLGYCAGVGKTYRMLQEAINNKHNQVDVVVGLVETHGRTETGALLSELEVMPRKKVEYAKLVIEEMDLDAILERKPQLVLVDELAHTNIPGSRHAKRYQDVEELLNAGIDVYSTLNIQHMQSLVDIVYQITNVKVDELIPDRILEVADEIELVDLPPEKLQQRLAEGKVYIPQKAKQAMQKFFKKGNLLALRELSLKYTAKRVDIDLLSYREREDISNVWPIEPKLLVGISSNKITEKILLIAHRMAADLEAEWYAVHVESSQQVKRSEKARNQLYRNIHLAEELGAKVVTLSGYDIAGELTTFSKQKNVTLIITGLSQRSRFQEIIKGSVLNRLIRKSGPINVLVVGDDQVTKDVSKSREAVETDYRHYLASFFYVLLFAGLGGIFHKWLSPNNFLLLLLLPTAASGILWGTRPCVFAALIALGIVDFFFIPPFNSFAITNLKYLISFGVFFFVSLSISLLGRLVRWRAESARHRERFIYALYNFGREMMSAESIQDILYRAVNSMSDAFESDVVILLPDSSGGLSFMTKSKDDLVLNETEVAVAIWVYKNGRPAGKSTNTLSSANWYYYPLRAQDSTIGVIGLVNSDLTKMISPEQKRLLESFASVVALALSKKFVPTSGVRHS